MTHGIDYSEDFLKRDKIVKLSSLVLIEPIVTISHPHLHQGTPSNPPRGNEPLTYVEMQPLAAKF